MIRIQRILWLALVVSTPAVALAGPGNDPPTTTAAATPQTLSQADRDVLIHHHHVNLMEVEMGRLATQRGGASVRKYAAKLIRDHQRADRTAVAIAKARGVDLASLMPAANGAPPAVADPARDRPASPDRATPDRPASGDAATPDEAMHGAHMVTMNRLRTLDGDDFDREFLMAMIDGHSQELNYLTTATADADDAKLKAHLARTRPVIERHVNEARTLLAQLHAQQGDATGPSTSPSTSPSTPTTKPTTKPTTPPSPTRPSTPSKPSTPPSTPSPDGQR